MPNRIKFLFVEGAMMHRRAFVVIKANEAATPARTPADITGLALWFDASKITGLSDGDAVTAWADSSINARNAVNKVGTVTYETNVINSLPVVRLAADGGLATDAFAWGSDKVTLFVVTALATGGTKVVCEFAPTGGNNGAGYSLYGKSQTIILVAFSNGCQNLGGRAITAGLPHVLELLSNRSLTTNEATGYVNGLTSGSRDPNTNNTGNFGTFAFFIGARNNASLFSAGDFAEIIAYNGALTDAERLVVEAYLSDKYNLGFVGLHQRHRRQHQAAGIHRGPQPCVLIASCPPCLRDRRNQRNP